LRWVLVRDAKGKLKTQAFLCTDQNAAPAQILDWFVKRWQVEVTFEEARAHLGMQTQQQWSTRAIARTTPAILALYSLVTLLATELVAHQSIAVRQYRDRAIQQLHQRGAQFGFTLERQDPIATGGIS
jgi:hypothetical protein